MAIDLDAFRKNYLVVGLTEEQIKDIAALAEVVNILPGQDLIDSDERTSDIFVILSGVVSVQTPKGEKLAEISVGGVLGEVALIDDQPRSANVVAVFPVKAAKIPSKDMRMMMNRNRDMGFIVLANIAKVLCSRLRKANMRLEYALSADPWKDTYS